MYREALICLLVRFAFSQEGTISINKDDDQYKTCFNESGIIDEIRADEL